MGRTMPALRICIFLILSIIAPVATGSNDTFLQDTLKENQVLYNGRVWRNLHTKIRGDQFLFTRDFMNGNVAMDGRLFLNVPLKYDIYHDELVTETNTGLILQLNKEMVDSFTLNYLSGRYVFVRTDSTEEYRGYVNLLYDGRSSFIVKYLKKIELLAVEKKFDQFYQVNKMYLKRGETMDQFNGRLEFFRLLGDYKGEVRSYMKKNKFIPSKNDPSGFVPLIKFYDSLQ